MEKCRIKQSKPVPHIFKQETPMSYYVIFYPKERVLHWTEDKPQTERIPKISKRTKVMQVKEGRTQHVGNKKDPSRV